MQQHVDAGLCAQPVEHALHRLRLEDHEHAAMALRTRDRAKPAQTLQHLFGDARHGLARRIAQRIEATIGDDVAQRRGAAETAGALEEQRARPAAGRCDGGGNSCTAAADDCDVVVGHHLNSQTTRVILRDCEFFDQAKFAGGASLQFSTDEDADPPRMKPSSSCWERGSPDPLRFTSGSGDPRSQQDHEHLSSAGASVFLISGAMQCAQRMAVSDQKTNTLERREG